MYGLEYTGLTLTAEYLKSSCQNWGLPGWHQRPPGLPAPSLLRVTGLKIGETQPPTEATGPAAHIVQRSHLVDIAMFVCVVKRGRKQEGGREREKQINAKCLPPIHLSMSEWNWPEMIYKEEVKERQSKMDKMSGYYQRPQGTVQYQYCGLELVKLTFIIEVWWVQRSGYDV